MKNKRKLFLSLSVMLLLAATGAYAVVGDQAIGTSIGNAVFLQYEDAVGTDYDTNASYDTAVAGIAGDTMTDPGNPGIAGAGASTSLLVFTVYNTGNAAETFSVTPAAASYSDNGAEDWFYSLGDADDSTAFSDGSESSVISNAYAPNTEQETITIGPIAEDATGTFSLWIKSSPSPAKSASGSTIALTISIWNNGLDSTAIVQTVEYTGDNDSTYAEGDAASTDVTIATISAPLLSVFKTADVLSAGGGTAQPIPGATIRYEIVINNAGAAAASNAIIFDTVPSSVTDFSTMTTRANWTAFWATNTSVNDVYGQNEDWNTWVIGTHPGDLAGGDTTNVRFVKWQRAAVPAAQQDTFYFNVIVE